MRRIVARKLCSRKNNSCVRASKQWPSTRPNCARCEKRLRDCGHSAWLTPPPTRRHRPPTEGCRVTRQSNPKRACRHAPRRPSERGDPVKGQSVAHALHARLTEEGLKRVITKTLLINRLGKSLGTLQCATVAATASR